ncbi:hypothetical protein ABK040_005299 [Willaertia magna]
MSDLYPSEWLKEIYVKASDTISHSFLGQYISYPCPHCNNWSTLAEYGGTVAEAPGLECPHCKRHFGSSDISEKEDAKRKIECNKCGSIHPLNEYKFDNEQQGVRCPNCNKLQL